MIYSWDADEVFCCLFASSSSFFFNVINPQIKVAKTRGEEQNQQTEGASFPSPTPPYFPVLHTHLWAWGHRG